MTIQKLLVYFVACLMCFGMSGRASAGVTMDWVDVGDPGNPEHRILKQDGTRGYGAVAYEFRLAKYETTNFQYAAFLNAVATTDSNNLYHPYMSSTAYGGITQTGTAGSYSYATKPYMADKPVNYVSWFDAARFANWFQNGQPTGMQDASTTEDGAYTFSGPVTISTRNEGALFYLPDEHEWDKAAFYEPGAVTSIGVGWWKHSSQSNATPTKATTDEFGNVTNPGPNVAVYGQNTNWNGSTLGNVTTVGSAGIESYYGARDMTGNIFEWVLADPSKPDPNGWGPYTVRGGSFMNDGHLSITERNLVHHDNHAIVSRNVGFRLAAAFLEPNPADFNNDTFVDQEDLEIWQQAYNDTAAGDADNDGDTDGRDFLIWQRQYTNTEPMAATAQVPEPSSWMLLGGLIAGCLFHRMNTRFFL